MNNIITQIFLESNHKQYEFGDFSLFSLIGQANFWIVVEREHLNGLLEEQIDLFLKGKEIVDNSSFDKNANLLIITKIDKLVNLDKTLILQIEEDLYHFKKSVIYYTEAEINNLKAKITDKDVVQNIESLILNESVFEQHKDSFDNNDYESLLYRIAHKIPFLKVNVKQTNNLESLEDLNNKSITDNTLNHILETQMFLITDESFATMSDDDILKLLKATTTDENQQNKNTEL